MQGIYPWMLVSIMLGAAGFFVAFSKAMRERKRLLSSLPRDTAESILEGEETLHEKLSRYTLVYSMLCFPAFMYTLLGAMLIYVFGVQTDAHVRAAIGALMALGLSSFFTNLGRSFIFREAMDGLNEREEGSTGDFGKYIVSLTMFETLAIFGLLVFELSLIYSGVMGTGTDLTMEGADMYLTGGIVFGLSTLCSLLMARLFNKLDGPLNGDEQLFMKKILYLFIGHIPAMLGLVVAIYLMMSQAGMIG